LVKRSLTSAFTLVELIIVIIIVGILASLGLTQYEQVVEKSRLAEAKVRIGVMRNLAFQYYLENGTLEGMTSEDVGTSSCSSKSFYTYWINNQYGSGYVKLIAQRCTSGGKNPNVSRMYYFGMVYYPESGSSIWHCRYADNSASCFGFNPSW
jgi:prepilin-type N-terminal cleavage/methylation domain-containing protein